MPSDNEEPQDLRSVLSQAVAEAETDTPLPERTPAEPVERPEPARDADTGGDDRPRGPDGKFVPKEGAAKANGANGADDSGEFETPEPTIPTEEPGPAAAEVPQHWSQADKDLIAGLPKEHQSKVVERYKAIEAGFTPRLQKAAEIERQFQGAMEIFQPHIEVLRQRGHTPSDVIRAYVAIEQDMITGQQQGGGNDLGARRVATMISAYGIDPGRVAAYLRGEQPEGGNGQPPAPISPQLMQEISSLRSQVNQITTGAQTQRENETQAQIDAFANEKDEAGALKHPYFSELERDMMALAQIEISQGKRPSIADLYDRAAYANRETRSKLLAANSAETQRKAAAERRAKAESATRAASSVTGTPGSGGSVAERRGATRSLREELEEAAAESR